MAYPRFAEIDGSHRLRDAVPDGYVDYQARKRPGGRVFFFNFHLAKEMGLIDDGHAHRLTDALSETILDTFGLVIINEYDIQHKRRFRPRDIKRGKYMATRYLQLQHPTRQGRTSGDGRGIWNGQFRGRQGTTWDVSSSGTGATRLSPASAIQKKFFRSGDPKVCYGNGYANLEDGFAGALMSEIFHRNHIPTERTLAIIEFPGKSAIIIRAGRNLIRPSHFFRPLKQGNLESLRGAVDHFIDRQVANQAWVLPSGVKRHEYFARQMARTFAETAARFESEYVFCWMDWDGDNILADGGIIDYGSVRQFGLFHRSYRYDDVERYSSTITEQRGHARYIVQSIAQIRDFLLTGRKRKIGKFAKDRLIAEFDAHFEITMDRFLLTRMGFDPRDAEWLMKTAAAEVRAFRGVFAYFERAQSGRGIHNVADGITSDAIFSMRDGLRELPRRLLAMVSQTGTPGPIPDPDFIGMIRSSYARQEDLRMSKLRRQRIREFQDRYLRLATLAGRSRPDQSLQRVLLRLTMASSVINRAERVTGNGILGATDAILKHRRTHSLAELHEITESFIDLQVLRPEAAPRKTTRKLRDAVERTHSHVRRCREGL